LREGNKMNSCMDCVRFIILMEGRDAGKGEMEGRV
jgi:hypothetical protein